MHTTGQNVWDDIAVTEVLSGATHAARGAVAAPGNSDEYTLVHFREGARVLTVDGRVVANPSGAVLYAPGHRQWFRGEWGALRYDLVRFRGPRAASLLQHLSLPVGRLFYPLACERTTQATEAMCAEREQGEPETGVVLAARLMLLLAEMTRGLREPGLFESPQGTLDRLQRIHFRIRRHPDADWSVPQMAREAMLSVSRFAALYRGNFGVSPMENVLRHRLEKARLLLGRGDMSVGEVAAKCGFRRQGYFTQQFSKRVGCTPREYRSGPRRAGSTCARTSPSTP